MIVLALLVIDSAIWYSLYLQSQDDKEKSRNKQNQQSQQNQPIPVYLPIQEPINTPNIDLTGLKDNSLEDYLWKKGILNPEETIWCDGFPLTPGNQDDMDKFMEIKNSAYLKGQYNSIPLKEGGERELYIDWFRLKGCSVYGANMLIDKGVNPWEFTDKYV